MNRRQSPDVWRTMTSVKYETLYTDPISLLRVIHHLANQRRMNMYSFKRPKRGDIVLPTAGQPLYLFIF